MAKRMVFQLVMGYLCAVGQLCAYPSEGPRLTVHFERLGPFGGEVRSLLIDKGDRRIVLLGTSDGRIFRSLDGGVSWNPLVPGIGRHEYVIDTLIQDPADSRHIYAGAWDLRSDGGGLFETRNAGDTWTQVVLPESSVAVRAMAICRAKPAYMIVGTLAGAFVTVDGGHEWRRVRSRSEELRNIESVAIDPVDPRFLLVGTWRLAYRSNDFGRTWARVNQGMIFDSDVFSLSINSRNPEIIYASACSGIYRSADRASTWTRLKVLPTRMVVRTQVVYADPSDSNRIYGGTTEGLFVSPDGGGAWSRITSPDISVNAIEVDPKDNQKIIIGTTAEGIMVSENGGRSWKESNRGFVRRQVPRIVPDPSTSGRFYAGILPDGGEGGFYAYGSTAADWTPLTAKIVPDLRAYSLLFLPGRFGRLVGTSRGIFLERPGELAWTRLEGAIARRTVYDLVLDPDGPWVFAGTDAGVYRARADRLQFQPPSINRFAPKVNSVIVSRDAPSAVYAGTSVGVLRSLDHGESWQVSSVSGIPSGVDVECLAACPLEKRHILAGTSAGLYESLDGGNTWRRENDGLPGAEVASVIFLDKTGKKILAADSTFGGVFYSEDGGQTWSKIVDPGYASPVRSLAQDCTRPDLIYAGTKSDGVYRLRFQEVSTTGSR